MKDQIYINQEEEYQEESSGINFADINDLNRKVLPLAPYDKALHHRSVYPGLNLQGICRNQTCKVFEKKVWIKKGYGKFSINEEINNSECPICQQQIPSETVLTLGYRLGNVVIEGKKLGPGEKKMKKQDKQTEGKLVKYEDYDSKTVFWEYLKVTIQKL